MSVNEDIADALIGRRMRLLDFEAGSVASVATIYDTAIEGLRVELERIEVRAARGLPTNAAEAARLRERVSALDDELRQAREAIRADLSADLNAVATVEAGQTAALLRAATGDLGVAWVALPGTAALATVGTQWATTLDVGLAATRGAVRVELASAFARGLGVDASVREIIRANAALKGERERLVTLVRTEFQRTANAAAMDTYRANADVIGAVRYLATLDLRVCPLCGPLHGRTYPLTADGPIGAPVAPRHPRCRCFYTPVTRSWAELGITGASFAERQRLDGRPAPAPSFDDWLRRQPEVAQRKVLGAAWRHDAWTAGADAASFARTSRLLTREQYAAS